MKRYLLAIAASSVVFSACSMQNSVSAPTPTPDTTMESGTDTSYSNTGATPMMSPSSDSMEAGVMVGGALMVPSKDIVDNAMNSKDHTTLVAAVKAAGLVDTLKGKGPFTVFAPTNAAFAKIPKATLDSLLTPAKKVDLTKILTYHAVPGRYTSADLTDGMKLKTVQGESITVNQVAGKWWVTDAKGGKAMITAADIIDSNGVTFVIDAVLMP